MCTLTLVSNENGYLLGMNRDEKITRGPASLPSVANIRSIQAVYPQDVEGGTWIAANSYGIAFALLNWNDAVRLHNKTCSRGSVIPALVSSETAASVDGTLACLDLHGILPFTLVGVFPAEKRIVEWQWDQNSLRHEGQAWTPRQWCSSSLSDAQAAMRRGLSYSRAQHEADVGSIDWLRRLHASHDDEQRPLSTCVHRTDVKTLSYTEFICTPEVVRCNHLAGSPCSRKEPLDSVSIARSPFEEVLHPSRTVLRPSL